AISPIEYPLSRRISISRRSALVMRDHFSFFSCAHSNRWRSNFKDNLPSLTDVIAMFDTGQGAAELQNVLELVNDAWNYFPHKVIGGLSPAEKLLEYKEQQK
ncbi:MAG TPA: hypothetical protein VJB92_03180, partial [Candidatus Paceibacterota bacterium]